MISSVLRGIGPVLIIFLTHSASAQNNRITRYLDEFGSPTSKDSAVYVSDCDKVDNIYVCSGYWIGSEELYNIAFYSDAEFNAPIALYRQYHKNGNLQDSIFYKEGNISFAYRYYENRELQGSVEQKGSKYVHKGYDKSGKEIKGFIFGREAKIKGESSAWSTFLSQNLDANIPIKNGAPSGKYQVIVRFIVEMDGSLSNFSAETNHGYGMEEEVIRTIKLSPRWSPAIQLNEPIKAFRRQPITFVVP